MLTSKPDMTIDGKHGQITAELHRTRTEVIPKLRAELAKVQDQLAKDNNNVEERRRLDERQQQLHKKIRSLRRKEQDYLLTNSSLIHEYFENKKNIGVVEGDKTVLDGFFQTSTLPEANPAHDAKKQTTVEKYFANVDERYLDMKSYVYERDVCQKCRKGELILVSQEGVLVCDHCAASSLYIIDNDSTPYKEPPKEVSFFAYKRINHFREVLAQFQGKQNTHIPDNIIEEIQAQVKKERLELKQLDNKRLKEILKKMGHNKYYEHIPFIKDKLGIKPPIMSPHLEETLCSMFMKIQAPYAKFCPSNRVNFLNYYYTVYKLCELLDQCQFLPFFPMLKDKDKRVEQDEVWRNICGELGWEFIPTI